MNSLLTCFLVLATLLQASAKKDERLIPFDHFYISVKTQQADEAHKFSLTLHLHRNKNVDFTGCYVEANLEEFEQALGRFEINGINAIISGAKALEAKNEYRKEIPADAYMEQKTILEVVKLKGQSMLRVSRAEEDVHLSLADIKSLQTSLKEAQIAKKWYEKLATAKKKPEEAPDAKPPISKEYSISSSLCSVKGGDLTYEIGLHLLKYGARKACRIEDSITYREEGDTSWAISGIDEIGDELNEAASALKDNKEYVFQSAEGEGWDYLVAADLKKKQVDVSLIVEEGKQPTKGSFNLAQIKQIQDAAKKYDVRKKWFEENLNLFVRDKEDK